MSDSESAPCGINHLTVVPENIDEDSQRSSESEK